MVALAGIGLARAQAQEDQPATGEGWTIEQVDIQEKPNHKFRGRVYFDQIWMEDMQGPVLQSQDNFTGFDTARIGVTGNLYENIKYCLEVEFESGETDYKDIYGQVGNLPWLGHCQIGHYKEPFGIEELVSSRFDTFMEQSAPTVAFAPTRNMGVMFFDAVDAAENLSWYVGLFRGGSHDNRQGRGTDDDGDSNDWSVTGRAVWLPYYDEATPGRCLLHCGLGCSFRRVGIDDDEGGNGGKLAGFLELNDRDGPINTYLPAFTEFEMLGTELAWMRGPLHVMNEFFFVDANTGATPWGTYVEIGYFLTGENRGYKKSAKAFDRVKVHEPFFSVRTTEGVARGKGAWQVAARFTYLDLTGAGFQPNTGLGVQRNFTFGLNWYLNSYNRMMLNYVHAVSDVTTGTGAFPVGTYEGDHFGVRYQIDW